MGKEKPTDPRTGEDEKPPEPDKPEAGLLDKLTRTVEGLLEKVAALNERTDKAERATFDLQEYLFGSKEKTEAQK